MNYALAYPFEVLLFRKWRKELLNGVKGKILEIGVGTGNNLKYYPKNCEVTAIDVDKKAVEKAKKIFKKYHNYKIMEMDAQNLTFDDSTFDYVISPLVLCSIPNPSKALKEINRVLKRNGELRTMEHVKSQKKYLYNLQSRLNGINKKIFGCDLTRNTEEEIKKSGFKITYSENIGIDDMFRYIYAKKQGGN